MSQYENCIYFLAGYSLQKHVQHLQIPYIHTLYLIIELFYIALDLQERLLDAYQQETFDPTAVHYKLAPMRKSSFKNDRPIWFSDELMEIIKDKDTLMQRAIQTKDEDDRRIARQARNRANHMVREAKSSYIKEQFDMLRHSPIFFGRISKMYYLNLMGRIELS